ncbi:MAG: hypothetical protein IJ820_05615 [Lachnospiraceae bacterium]|nr:hypothetical protein [Lachnospiraceae bacterium]
MVRELQHRFIKVTMLVVTILLVTFLAVMNIVNFALSRRDSRAVLSRIIVRDAYQLRMPGVPEDGNAPGGPEEGNAPGAPEGGNAPGGPDDGGAAGAAERPDIESDAEGSLGVYFTAAVNENGAIIYSDLSHASDLTEEDIIPLLQSASKGLGIEVTAQTETEADAEAAGSVPAAGQSGMGEPPAKPDGREERPAAGDDTVSRAVRHETGRTGSYMYRTTLQEDGCVTYAFLDIRR